MKSPRRLRLLVVLALFIAFALAIGLFWRWQQNQLRVGLGPQQIVATSNLKAGIHTRLDIEVEPWKIKRTLEMVREMGAPWVVEYFPWAYIEPRRGRYEWERADLIIDLANRQGLTVIARLGFVPEWAKPAGSVSTYLDDDHFQDFARHAAAFAEHFRGRVKYIIVWNEPNLALEWGYRKPDPDGYTRLLCQAATAIRQVNPDVVILGGALAPTLGDPTGELGMNDLEFLQAMYDAGAKPCFDALAVHAYGLTFAPDDPPDPDVINFRRVELLREIMFRNGDDAKSIHITEAGWNDHPRWTRAVRPAQRIRYTLRAYELAQGWPWLASLSMWAFRYPWLEKNVRDYYTFVTPDFEPKAIYRDVQAVLRGAE